MNARIAAIAIGAVLIFCLSGCTPAPTTSESGGPSPAASESVSPSPSASATPGPSATPAASEPITEDCLDLVSLDTMYGFDPNFAYDDSFTPASGSLAAAAVASGGIACGWIRETGGDTIVISASRPAAAELESRRAAAVDAPFSLDGESGVVQVVEGDAWITATSAYFSSSADAAPLIDSVVAALR